MINNISSLVNSFAPVLFNRWILKISVNTLTSQICVVMHHQTKALLRIGFFDTEDEANNFVCTVIEEMGNV